MRAASGAPCSPAQPHTPHPLLGFCPSLAAPRGLSALTRLTHLCLGGNLFEDGLDAEVGGLADEEAVLPSCCSTLTALQYLDLSGCGLELVPSVLEVSPVQGMAPVQRAGAACKGFTGCCAWREACKRVSHRCFGRSHPPTHPTQTAPPTASTVEPGGAAHAAAGNQRAQRGQRAARAQRAQRAAPPLPRVQCPHAGAATGAPLAASRVGIATLLAGQRAAHPPPMLPSALCFAGLHRPAGPHLPAPGQLRAPGQPASRPLPGFTGGAAHSCGRGPVGGRQAVLCAGGQS